ncbi:WD40 repeat domain-containing protein [Candidatus Bathyarchaeota archaeon]|nr:WD40 repeat domain-containing protein [Candidatus Bathyarchaeota archaeon]
MYSVSGEHCQPPSIANEELHTGSPSRRRAPADSASMDVVQDPVPSADLAQLATTNSKDTRSYFDRTDSKRLKLSSGNAQELFHSRIKVAETSEYAHVQSLPPALAAAQAPPASRRKSARKQADSGREVKLIEGADAVNEVSDTQAPTGMQVSTQLRGAPETSSTRSLASHVATQPKPDWHAPWKLMRVISGHLGWVRALAVDPDNKWFASGAGDRTIKIWDLATGSLRLTLTGHISTVRGLAVSPRHPYLFSCGEDKMVKCWDLETNKVIRHYHGHLSGVYALSLHPTLDVLVTGGRDGVARVWDMRTRANVHVLSGHTGTISDLRCQESDPQIISSSLDSTVRLWDLAAGKTMGVLTHHKKGVRALALHPTEYTFASASTGSIKQWKCPEGAFMQNFDGHNSIINNLAVNADNVLFSGGMFHPPPALHLRHPHGMFELTFTP